jgi:formylglycine-generating enzyme required for sulfatase activity
VIQSFDGVDMVLVPPGCFNMGSDAEGADDDEQPVHQQCFDAPFWLDRTEVTNAAFGSAGMFAGDDLPRDTVPMPDAIAHCEARGARLPTEAEWEYAARGPSAWTFPWGNDFNGLNVVYVGSSGGESAAVGSRPGGASWVGAVDLSGNLWEWTSTIYGYDYPYVSDDGREDLSNLNMPRAIRGGSWSNESVWMRGSVRKAKHPTVEYYVYVGFRCARDY